MSRPNLFVPDRRQFVKTTGGALAALAAPRFVHAAGQDTLRVGLVGCGGRGTGAALNCVQSSPGVVIHAMGDLFPDRVRSSHEKLSGGGIGDAFQVTEERLFTGFDAYQGVLASGVDVVILATPPHFRPAHLRAAVEAGVHVFTEKPVAVDGAGVRSVLETARMAQEQGLAIVAGTQRRYQEPYREALKRVHDGAIGELVGAQCYWNQGGLWMHPREEGWSDMEWQLRNWLYFTWLSGDHIVEQHVHNLDVLNWAFRAHPERCWATGGREVRTDPAYGNVFDHFAVEYEYPGGVRAHSFCRQIDGCASRVAEHLVGTGGTCDPGGWIRGESNWRWTGDFRNPYEQEHAELIESIRAGEPRNDGVQVAEATLTAILGRMSAYTGKEVTWEQALESKLDLRPPAYELGDLPVRPVAVPGTTELI